MEVRWTKLFNTLLIKVLPPNKLIHTKVMTHGHVQFKEEPSRLKNSSMSQKDNAMHYKMQLINSQFLSELMPKTGNSTLEVSSLIAESD
jgi:hypothetical protein